MFIKPEQIVDALTLLRDAHQFELLSALTAVDYWPQMEPRFHTVYQLVSTPKRSRLTLRVLIKGSQPSPAQPEGMGSKLTSSA